MRVGTTGLDISRPRKAEKMQAEVQNIFQKFVAWRTRAHVKLAISKTYGEEPYLTILILVRG